MFYLNENILAFVLIIIGLVYCFFGYRIFKIILAIFGFAIGAPLSASIAYGASGGEEIIVIIAAIIGGIVCAGLMVFLYFIGVFLLGAGIGCLLGIIFAQAVSFYPPPVFLLIIAVIGGILTLVFQKLMIIITTSFGGSWSIVTGIFYFSGREFNPIWYFQDLDRLKYYGNQFYIMLLLWIIIGLAGVLVQYILTWRKKAPQKIT